MYMILIIVVLIVLLVYYTNYAPLKNTEDIKAAKIVNTIQWHKEKLEPSGVSYGRGGSRVYWRVKKVPTHKEVVFEVTYTNGKVRKISTTEGSKRYDQIMHCLERTRPVQKPTVSKSITTNTIPNEVSVAPLEIKKNQLTAGVYVIGKDIPEGRYDLVLIWGRGSITKYVDKTTALGASNYFQWIGNEHSYEQQRCVGIVCKGGEYMRIDGNVIVEIKKSKEIEIDL